MSIIPILWCKLTITHFSIFLPYSIFIFIPLFHSTSSDLFLFSSCMMFDLGSTSTHYSCLFDMSVPLSSLFMLGSLSPRLMMFATYCISCMRDMGFISLRLLSLVSFRFFSPYCLNLHYVPCLKTTLRSWLHIMLDSSHMGNTWDWLEIIS